MDRRYGLAIEGLITQDQLNLAIDKGYQKWFPDHPNALAVKVARKARGGGGG